MTFSLQIIKSQAVQNTREEMPSSNYYDCFINKLIGELIVETTKCNKVPGIKLLALNNYFIRLVSNALTRL